MKRSIPPWPPVVRCRMADADAGMVARHLPRSNRRAPRPRRPLLSIPSARSRSSRPARRYMASGRSARAVRPAPMHCATRRATPARAHRGAPGKPGFLRRPTASAGLGQCRTLDQATPRQRLRTHRIPRQTPKKPRVRRHIRTRASRGLTAIAADSGSFSGLATPQPSAHTMTTIDWLGRQKKRAWECVHEVCRCRRSARYGPDDRAVAGKIEEQRR